MVDFQIQKSDRDPTRKDEPIHPQYENDPDNFHNEHLVPVPPRTLGREKRAQTMLCLLKNK